MKIINNNKLLEEINNVGDFEPRIHPEAPASFADAVEDARKQEDAIKDKLDKHIKETTKDLDNTEKDRIEGNKIDRAEGSKKMHLEESLFTDSIDDTIEVKDSEYIFDDETGLIHLVDYLTYCDIGDYLKIKFTDDNDEKVYQYKVIEIDDDEENYPIILEYIGEQKDTLTEYMTPKKDIDELTDEDIYTMMYGKLARDGELYTKDIEGKQTSTRVNYGIGYPVSQISSDTNSAGVDCIKISADTKEDLENARIIADHYDCDYEIKKNNIYSKHKYSILIDYGSADLEKLSNDADKLGTPGVELKQVSVQDSEEEL